VDQDVDGVVFESGEPVFVRGGEAGQRRSMLYEHGDPAPLVHAERTVVQHDDVAALTLPPVRGDMGPNGVIVVAELA
jgi:hypothetical protein